MTRRIWTGGLALLATAALAAQFGTRPATLSAQTSGTQTPSPYAGQQDSSVRGLTEAEVAAFRAGRGMGLARPGEINGYPGPMHVLELAEDLALNDEQRATMQALVDQMKAEAVPLGERFLARYAALEGAFRDGEITAESLQQHAVAIGQVEGALRATHLKYHLLTKPLLTDAQLAAYAHLRGYTANPATEPAAPRHMPGGHGANWSWLAG